MRPADVASEGRDHDAVEAYEELRSHRLAGSPLGRNSGLVLLLREGLAAWMTQRVTRRAARVRRPSRHLEASDVPRVVADEMHVGVLQVLADMILAGHERRHV